MLTDDQLIQEIRAKLHAELADLNPPEGFLDRVWADADAPKGTGKPARRSRRRLGDLGTVFGLGLAVFVVAVVAMVALVVLHPNRQHSGQSEAYSAQPLLRILGVLRRPQGHLGETIQQILGPGPLAALAAGTPDVPLIRLATVTPWGQKVYLVPFKPQLSARTLAGLPPQLRKFAARRIALEGGALRHAYRLGIFAGGGGGGATASAIEAHGTATWGGDSNSTQLILVVPDGVANVTLLLPASQAGFTDTSRPRTVTGRVHNNVVAVSFQGASDNPVQNMIWYGPHGNVVKRIGDISGLRQSVPALPPGACPAPATRYLPPTADCLVIREGDVDGDRKPDLVLLYTPTHEPANQRIPSRLTLGVVRASGGLVHTPIVQQGPDPSTIFRIRNVNSRPGAEIFVAHGESAIGSLMSVYTFNGRALIQAGSFLSGGEFGHPHGIFCHAGNPPTIVQRALVLVGHAPNGNGRWHETITTYAWSGSTLRRASRQTVSVTFPHYPANLSGFNC